MYRIRNRVVQTMDMANSAWLPREFDVTCIVAGGQNLDIILYIVFMFRSIEISRFYCTSV